MARNMYRRKRELALGIVLGLGAQTGWAQSAAEKALLGQGLHWQAQGNPDRAAEVWKKLLRMKPDQPQALYGLAQVEINLKRNAGATEILARLRGLDPKGRYTLQLAQDIALNTGDAPKTLERARLLNESGETDKAIEQYQLALGGSEPVGDIGLEYYRCLSKSATGWGAARTGFERLAKTAPSDPLIELNLAFLLARGEEPRWETRVEGIERLARVAMVPAVRGFATESWKMALGWLGVTRPDMLGLFDAYLKRHPNDAEVRELRASAVKKLGAQAKAAQPNPQISAGLKALHQGDAAQAESEYLARLKSSPRDPDALGGLGLVRMQQNRWDEALALLTQATQQGNGNNWNKALQAVRYQTLVERGLTAQREGDMARARSLLQQAIALDPKQNGALLALAALQFAAGEVDAAEGSYRQALARNASDADALRGLVGLLAGADKLDEARSLLQRLTPEQLGGVDEMNRLRAAVANGASRAALRRGDVALAQATLEKAMGQDRDNPWIRWELAQLYVQQGRSSEARGLIDGLLASQPDNPVALYASAHLAADRGQWAVALETLDRIARKDRNADIAALQRRSWLQHQGARAVSLARQGRKAEALALLEQAAPVAAGKREMIGLLAEAYADAGSPNRGLALLRQLMAASSQPLVADLLQYAGLLLKTQQDVECAGILKELAGKKLSANERKTLEDLGFFLALRQVDLLRERKELAAARELLAPMLAQRPEDPLANAALARWTVASGDRRRGLELARSLSGRFPDNATVQLSVAQLATQFKDTELASTALKAALALTPEDAELVASAARLALAQGKSAQAAALFERAIALQNAPAPKPTGLVLAAASGYTPDALTQSAGLQGAPMSSTTTRPGDYFPQALSAVAPAWTVAATANAPAEPPPPKGAPRSLSSELDAIREARSPQALAGVQSRKRNGKSGSSALQQTELPLEVHLPLGEGRLKLQLNAIKLDAGKAPTGAARTSTASGMAGSLAYTEAGFAADLGQTAAGFLKKNFTGGIRAAGALLDDGTWTYRVNLSRRPVTDSLLSYAGARDSATGRVWGGVTATGARLDLGKDMGGFGLVGNASWHTLRGREVASNGRTELGFGGYLDLVNRSDSKLSTGLNFSALGYQKNLSEFSLGQGGYFSPQRYGALTVPLNWAQRSGSTSYQLQASLGYQQFSQDAPGGAATPAEPSSSGLAYKLAASAQYQMAPQWLLDASVQSDNTASGSYRQWGAGLNLRYSFYPSSQAAALPLVSYGPAYGQ